LIHAWNEHYPPTVFSSLWDNLDNLIDENRLISPDDVLLELQVGGDDLYQWAKSRPNLFHSPADEEIEVVTYLRNNHPNFKPKGTARYWADPYLIALACTKQAVVVSQETNANPGERTSYIPDICQHLGLRHFSLLEMIMQEQWRF